MRVLIVFFKKLHVQEDSHCQYVQYCDGFFAWGQHTLLQALLTTLSHTAAHTGQLLSPCTHNHAYPTS